MTNKISFDFVVARVQSLADGAPRLLLDLQEQDVAVAAMLWEAKLQGMVLHAVVTAYRLDLDENERKRTERKTRGTQKTG